MVMNKKDFVDYLAENYEGIVCALSGGHDIKLAGFGQFTLNEVEARERRNPITGETFMAEAHKVPKFKFASNVKADLR